MNVREDKEIITDIKNGSMVAMDELIKKYQKRVYNIVFGLCMNYDTAWDVSQEAFIKVIRNIKNFRGESSFWTYLYRIVINSFYDWTRKEKTKKKSTSNFSDMTDDENKRSYEIKDLVNVEEDFDRKMLGEKVNRGLDDLTDAQRQVYVLKNLEGMKIREIADVMKISEGTVKSHLSRAMEKLCNVLKG
ncbi:MAG: RNA polymerase sigma factor [Candidatus Goldbacteria bacterium]|nr:RNA polymerase sigma factor [Candidatus Goldiibacteriota bacterium]HPD18528.1 RNA polymerase sigma factor [Candidatus Goldiibacteriota bacterium]